MVDRQPVLPVGVRVALGLLIVAALASLPAPASRILGYVRSVHGGEDEVSGFDRRFAPVRDALLASGIRKVGYLPRGGPLKRRGLAGDPHFLLTRYALAPVRVYPDLQRRVIFDDFADERIAGGAIPTGFEVLRQFGDGRVLLRPAQQ